jgi:hypothetical protein
MSEESEIRVERIKKILGFEHDVELARLCESRPKQISIWRNKGFTKSYERILDALMDRYDQDKRAKKGPAPKLSIGHRIRRARKGQRLSQRDLAERMYGAEGFSDNALRMKGSRLEKLEEIDEQTLSMVTQALGIPKEEL